MEATLVGVVLTAIGQLTIVHVVLATAVALDDANDDEKEDEEGKCEDHPDEPSGSDDASVAVLHRNDI